MNLRRLLFVCAVTWLAATALACTSAIISAERTVDGRPLLWKHRDTSNANSRIAYVAPEKLGELAYTGLFNSDDTGNTQVWIGMNEAGFAIMNTASYNLLPKGVKGADKEGLLMAKALKCCKTVDDFAWLLLSMPHPLGVETNFGVIDALGNGAFFETDNEHYTRFDLKDAPEGILVRTNYSYSGRKGEGSGYIRHNNALHFLLPMAKDRCITPQFLTEIVSRRFYRSDSDREWLNDTIRIIPDVDFIPRYTSVATVVVEGMIPQSALPDSVVVAKQYIMWTGLGYPPCAEIRPVWCRADGVEPALQGKGRNNHAPLADEAQRRRLEVFSTRQKKEKIRFVDLDKLYNAKGNGFTQQITVVNLDTYRRYRYR